MVVDAFSSLSFFLFFSLFFFSFFFFLFIAWVTGFPALTASAFFNKCCTWSLAVFFDKCCTWSLAVFFDKCCTWSLAVFFDKCCTWSLAVFFNKRCTWSLAVSLGLLRQILAVSLLLVSSSKHAPYVSQSVPGPYGGPEKRTLSLSWGRFNEHGYKLC